MANFALKCYEGCGGRLNIVGRCVKCGQVPEYVKNLYLKEKEYLKEISDCKSKNNKRKKN